MQYLECIAMLCYLEAKLSARQQVQVSVQAASEAYGIIAQISKKMEKDPNITGQYHLCINDLMDTLAMVMHPQGLLCLTESMKNVVVEGILILKGELGVLAYRWFTVNPIPESMCSSFETRSDDAQSPRKILRQVASAAISRGLYKQ